MNPYICKSSMSAKAPNLQNEFTKYRCWCTYRLPSFASLHGSSSDKSTGNSLISQLNQLLVVVISRFSVAFVKFPVLSPSVNSIVPATCDMLKYAMIGPFCPSTPKNKQYHLVLHILLCLSMC